MSSSKTLYKSEGTVMDGYTIPAEDDLFWGEDGTDPSTPVRAHVLAALRPDQAPYPPPVDALRLIGNPQGSFFNLYADIRQIHAADLVRMARDRNLFAAPSDSDVVWSQTHAIEALSTLDVAPVVADLVPLLDVQSDWLLERLPEVIARAGDAAFGPLSDYLDDRSRWGWGHTAAISALEEIAATSPSRRATVIARLNEILYEAATYSEITCTAAMDVLVELGATDSLALIRRAFELGKIDESVRGTWSQVLIDLRQPVDPRDPLIAESERRFEEREERFMPSELRELLLELMAGAESRALPRSSSTHRSADQRARKEKHKHKAQSSARKANRRKKR